MGNGGHGEVVNDDHEVEESGREVEESGGREVVSDRVEVANDDHEVESGGREVACCENEQGP